MKQFLNILIAGLVVSCTADTPSPPQHMQPNIDEMVDLRIFTDGDIRFNGEMITTSGLPSHIESLRPYRSAKARIIFDENVPAAVVHKTQRLLHENKITNIYSKMLSSEDFKQYNQHVVHLDVLSSGDILLEGIRLYPEDLPISLQSSMVNKSPEFILTVSNDAQMGSVSEVQQLLVANQFTKITHQDVSKYYR